MNGNRLLIDDEIKASIREAIANVKAHNKALARRRAIYRRKARASAAK